MEIRRGEIWLANLSPTQGTEQAGIRPVLIIQTDRANPYSPHTVIVPFTTKIRKEILPSHVSIKAGSEGTKEDSVLLCEQIRVIDKQRLIKKIGKLDETTMGKVAEAIRAVLDL
ncbi:MAG: type II toxin-antitoxin system PemK/MazF family toxin [Candidatus Brocadiaceae bacterium]|uniref:type II toxin-antitoxin system PemK/MazF family toxin n=1 Tax=Candidatus Wunengus sp. YC61 TaxID=3367698 RepID=UPI00271B038D|nr:type II toxin-antitoxin system PemK/MazF family toxin [Candidatus Brocadiaceae bacterium]